MFDFGFGDFGLFRFLFRLFRWFRSGCSGGFVPVVSGFSTCPIPARCLPNMSENFTVRKCSRVFILQEDTFGIVLAQ